MRPQPSGSHYARPRRRQSTYFWLLLVAFFFGPASGCDRASPSSPSPPAKSLPQVQVSFDPNPVRATIVRVVDETVTYQVSATVRFSESAGTAGRLTEVRHHSSESWRHDERNSRGRPAVLCIRKRIGRVQPAVRYQSSCGRDLAILSEWDGRAGTCIQQPDQPGSCSAAGAHAYARSDRA
jgi:hypothetical protein